MSDSRIRVIIVDDHDLVRNGLAILLEAFEDLGLAGAVANGAEAMRLCDKTETNVALMSLTTPKMGSIAAIRSLCQRHPQVRVVALISFGDEELLETVMQAGASSYVFKNAPIDHIAEAIRTAARDSSPGGALPRSTPPPARQSRDPSGTRSYRPQAP